MAALLLGALLGAGVVAWFSLLSPDDALSSGSFSIAIAANEFGPAGRAGRG